MSVVPGLAVYLPDNQSVWLKGKVLMVEDDKCTVAVLHTEETSVHECDTLLPSSDQRLLSVDNLIQLAPINQASVLCCLNERFAHDLFYTSAGSTVIAINPFKDIQNLYSRDLVMAYHENTEDSPHIYSKAGDAFRHLCRGLGKANQCIIVSGESGSGKTVSAKHLLRYLTLVAIGKGEQDQVCSSIEQRILDSNPILEAFGNAVTQRNDNSSRFGKFIKVQFSRNGQMVGAEIHTYLLEKTRVVHQSQDESNFHIFYQVMESLSADLESTLSELVRRLGKEAFCTLPAVRNHHAHRDLNTTLCAMTQIGLSDGVQRDVTKVLVAILFICNIKISAIEEELCELLNDNVSQTSLQQAASLLGVETASLEQVLLYRNIKSGGDRRLSVFIKPVPEREANSRRDCLATLVYSRLFDWLASFINGQIKPKDYDYTIGLLDIYGFEAFESNSLEQLCINYANEKLQQHYVKHFLKDLQQEYEEECISWEALAYTDNQACLQILEGNCSVFTILNEDIQLNRQTDTVQLCERVLFLCRTSQFLKKPRHYMKEPGFSVKHYAGEVTYSMDQLSTKNRDSIPPEIVSMLANSSNQFISSLFSEMDIDEGTGKRRKTVLGKFKASLDGLMSSLGSSDVHYIRCIKPNTKSLPGLFDCQYVMSQLVAGGIIETVRICSLGYPVRMAYSEFLHRYGMILRNSPTPPSSQSSVDNDILYEPLDTLYMKQLDMFHNSPQKHNTPKKRLRRRAGLSNCDHLRRCSAAVLAILYGDCKGLTGQFGRTKLFLHQHQVDRLEERRYTILCMKASIIQRYWRAHHRRQRLSVIHLSVSARVIQAAWRSYVQHKLSKAVLVMQKWFRMHMCRKQYKRLQEQRQKACKEAKRKQASWKPIMDRKRTSSGSKRSKTSSRSSSRVHSADSSRGVSDSSGILSSDNSSLMDSDQHMDVSEECKASPFSTSTPKSTSAVHMFSADSDGILAGQKENVSPSKRKALMPRGRPNFRRSPQTKFKLKRKHCSSNNGNRIEHSGMSPVKKMKTPYGYKVTQEDGLNVGDGIITRRKLPSGPVRFHTRASVLKHAHKLHHKELVKGLLDCLPHTPIK